MSQFPCDAPISANITLGAGECVVRTSDDNMVTVNVTPHKNDSWSAETAEHTKVDFKDGKLRVEVPEGVTGWLFGRRSGAIKIDITLPTGSRLTAKAASASIAFHGEYDYTSATTASGAITVEKTAEASLNTASGDVHLTECTGPVRGNTVSADLQIDHGDGEVNAKSVSGDIRVGYAGREVQANSVSGDITISSLKTGSSRIRSVSGAVSVGVAPGTGVWMDLNSVSGTTSSDLAVGDLPSGGVASVELFVNTVSGNIDLFRAQPA